MGVVAAIANIVGGLIVYARPWRKTFLAYFIALGSGFMLATAITEMIPESLRLAPLRAPALILAGYFVVHIFEHAWPAHFHFGEETHADQFLNPRVAYTALGGLLVHTFFGGVAIASGFLVSTWLGTVILGATLLHNVPEGFTMASIMSAAGKARSKGMAAVLALGVSRLLGVVAMAAAYRHVNIGLSLSAGVTLYVAASDLIPEVSKMPGLRLTLTLAAGIFLVVLLRMAFFAYAAP